MRGGLLEEQRLWRNGGPGVEKPGFERQGLYPLLYP